MEELAKDLLAKIGNECANVPHDQLFKDEHAIKLVRSALIAAHQSGISEVLEQRWITYGQCCEIKRTAVENYGWEDAQ